MADFVEAEADMFRPQYGEVDWHPRFELLLEATGVHIVPVAYTEDGDHKMQITQENTIVYINQIADEMDCIAVKYDMDEADTWTWYFRNSFANIPMEHVIGAIGVWSDVQTTLYPKRHVVEQYERFAAKDLDTVPDWL